MKKIIVIIILQITFLSCVKESRMYSRQYSLKNETNKNVKLKFYLKYDNQLVYGEVITLNNTEVFNTEKLEFSQPHSNDENYLVNTSFRASDSLVIIYNNQKQSIYLVDFNGNFSTPIERNPFRHGNYEDIENDTFQFIFTEEDYNNAADCNGDCD